jgi:hypothetical protein
VSLVGKIDKLVARLFLVAHFLLSTMVWSNLVSDRSSSQLVPAVVPAGQPCRGRPRHQACRPHLPRDIHVGRRAGEEDARCRRRRECELERSFNQVWISLQQCATGVRSRSMSA